MLFLLIGCKRYLGVATDPDKISFVRDWKVTSIVTELHAFPVFASYYQCFEEGYARYVAPLHKLVAKLHSNPKKKEQYNTSLQDY